MLFLFFSAVFGASISLPASFASSWAIKQTNSQNNVTRSFYGMLWSDKNGDRLHQKLVFPNGGSFIDLDSLYLKTSDTSRACFQFDPVNGTCSTFCPLDPNSNCRGCADCENFKVCRLFLVFLFFFFFFEEKVASPCSVSSTIHKQLLPKDAEV
jgi:hypothetical protein